MLHSSPNDVVRRLERLLREEAETRRTLAEYRKAWIDASIKGINAEAAEINGFRFHVWIPGLTDNKAIREVLRRATSEHRDLAILAAYRKDERTIIEASAGSMAVERGFDAAGLVKALLDELGGRGGGKRDHATGTTSAEPEEVAVKAWSLAKRLYASG